MAIQPGLDLQTDTSDLEEKNLSAYIGLVSNRLRQFLGKLVHKKLLAQNLPP